MIKPKALKKGDTIGIIAPSSPEDKEKLHDSTKILEGLGFKVVHGRSCYENYGYLAGDDELRAFDINTMFRNPKIDAIFCMRGGYGSIRILDLIDYNVIHKNPKIFMGYSDITALHIAIVQKTNLVTFHGPMLTSDFLSPGFESYTKASMLKALTRPIPLGKIESPIEETKSTMLKPGNAQGEIIGGNLSLLVSTLGTPYEIDTRGKILLIEETGEEPYKIDRMLTQLRLSGKLYDVEGIALCQFTNCEPSDSTKSFSLDEMFKEVFSFFKKPIIKNVYTGHGESMATIPLGVLGKIDGSKGVFIVEENAVK